MPDSGKEDGAVQPRRVGSYELVYLLGRGGSAEVFIARHRVSGDLWALKLAKEGLPGAESIFREERRNASTLNHQHILQAQELGDHEGRPYLVFPLLSGDSLADGGRQAKYGEPQRALALMSKLASAVQYAHSRAILHCDLKPANILFDDDEQPHIADFGLSRRIQSSGSTQGEAYGGTRGWMSPEQVTRTPIGVASDVFSLGVILYWLLRGPNATWGGLPFGDDEGFEERVLTLTAESPLPVRRWSRRRDWALAAICRKALAREVSERYPTAQALVDDLRRAELDLPLGDQRHRPLGRIARWVQRNALVAIVGIELGLLLLYTPFVPSAALSEVRSTIRTQNQFSATAQAGAVMNELRALALRVHAMARDPEIARLVTHGNMTVAAPALAVHAVDFDSVNVFSSDGVHQARSPTLSDQPTENVAYKDFFQCAARLANELRAPNRAQREIDLPVCVARAHRSRVDDKVKLGLAAPLMADGKMIGVVEGSTKVRDRFGAIQMSCGRGDCWTALLASRDRDSERSPLPTTLSILAQVGLAEGQEVPLPAALSRTLCRGVPCAPSDSAQFQPRAKVRPLLLEHYRDPITSNYGLAAVAPVAGTGLIVLIATPDSAADHQVSRLFESMRRHSWTPLLFGFFLWCALRFAPNPPWMWPRVRQSRPSQ